MREVGCPSVPPESKGGEKKRYSATLESAGWLASLYKQSDTIWMRPIVSSVSLACFVKTIKRYVFLFNHQPHVSCSVKHRTKWCKLDHWGGHISIFHTPEGEVTPLIPRGDYALTGELSYFHQAEQRLQECQPGSHYTSCWRGKKDTVLSVLSLLIDATASLSAGYGANQCVPLHENVFDEFRLSKQLSARYRGTRRV